MSGGESRELRVVPARDLPIPTAWSIACPCCGAALDYEPVEDDAGQYTPVENWPVCEPCEIVVEPATVAIRAAPGGPYWQRSHT